MWQNHYSHLPIPKDSDTAPTSAVNASKEVEMEKSRSQKSKKKGKRVDSTFIANIISGTTTPSSNSNLSKDEMKEYENEDLFPSHCDPDDVLVYWAGKKKKWPRLSIMARDMLSIPATSASSERAFSAGKDVFGISRMRLCPETVEALVCLRSWYRAGLIEEADVHEFVHDHDPDLNE